MQVRNKRDIAVTIAPPGSQAGINVEAGGTVEVDDDLGKSLLQQSDRWEPVAQPKTPKKENDR